MKATKTSKIKDAVDTCLQNRFRADFFWLYSPQIKRKPERPPIDLSHLPSEIITICNQLVVADCIYCCPDLSKSVQIFGNHINFSCSGNDTFEFGEGRANAGSIGSNSSTRRIERIEPRICTSVEPHRCIVSPAFEQKQGSNKGQTMTHYSHYTCLQHVHNVYVYTCLQDRNMSTEWYKYVQVPPMSSQTFFVE